MNKIKFSVFIVALLILCACSPSPATLEKQGVAQIGLFKECLALASKLELKGESTANVIDSCANNSYYMSRYIK